MTEAQRENVAGSIAEFELGERSEGRSLMAFARKHAQAMNDPDYVAAMAAFIAEENRHARYLERVMRDEALPRAEQTSADSVFRFARKLASLELSIMVLVTAEVIAQVYYRGLRDATDSTVLRAVCQQILRDEKHHIRFQGQRLAILRQRRSRVTIWRRRWTQRALLAAAVLVVWRNHGRALRQGGYTFRVFSQEVAIRGERLRRIADPAGYSFGLGWSARLA